jgi:hypothetical protein
MERTACPVYLVSTVSGHCKNILGRPSTSTGHIKKLEQSTFLRYLWVGYSALFTLLFRWHAGVISLLQGDDAIFAQLA